MMSTPALDDIAAREKRAIRRGTTLIAFVVAGVSGILTLLAFFGALPKDVRLFAFGILVATIPVGLMGIRESDAVAVYVTSAVAARLFSIACVAFILEALIYVGTWKEACPFETKVQCGNAFWIALLNAFNDPFTIIGLLTNLRRRPDAMPLCASIMATPAFARKQYGPVKGTLCVVFVTEWAWAHMNALEGTFARTPKESLDRAWFCIRSWFLLYGMLLLVLPIVLWSLYGAEGMDRTVSISKLFSANMLLGAVLCTIDPIRFRYQAFLANMAGGSTVQSMPEPKQVGAADCD